MILIINFENSTFIEDLFEDIDQEKLVEAEKKTPPQQKNNPFITSYLKFL